MWNLALLFLHPVLVLILAGGLGVSLLCKVHLLGKRAEVFVFVESVDFLENGFGHVIVVVFLQIVEPGLRLSSYSKLLPEKVLSGGGQLVLLISHRRVHWRRGNRSEEVLRVTVHSLVQILDRDFVLLVFLLGNLQFLLQSFGLILRFLQLDLSVLDQALQLGVPLNQLLVFELQFIDFAFLFEDDGLE